MPSVDETTEFKLRRGTSGQMATFTGAQNEFTHETDTGRLVLHDGSTAGGAFKFPNIADIQKQSIVYATAGGTANALTLTLSPAPAAWVAGLGFWFKAASNNTGAATINVNSLGAKTLKKNGGADDLEADDIVSGGIYKGVYDGTNVQITGGIATAGGAYDLLERVSSSSSVAQVDIEAGTWSDYDAILLEIHHLRPVNSGVTLQARLKIGGSYVTAGNYAWGFLNFNHNTGNNTDEGQPADTEIHLSPSAGLNNNGDDTVRMTLKISQPGDTANWKAITFHYAASVGATSLDGAIGGAVCDDSTGAISGIRLFTTSGNISQITYSLWGLRQS